MIPANELRIGNLYYPKGTNHAAVINANNIGAIEKGVGLEFYQPIPLTPEILEKCGFEKTNEFTFSKSGIKLTPIRDLYFRAQFPIKADIKFLHHLQNLYFALTNTKVTYTP